MSNKQYKKSSIGMFKIRIPQLFILSYQTTGISKKEPVRTPLTAMNGTKTNKNER